MVFADRVVEERATFVQRPCTDDIAGQEVARATRIIFGQVLCLMGPLTTKGAACRKSERALTRLSVVLGIFPVLGLLLYDTTVIVGAVVPFWGPWQIPRIHP
jgi:hypothetical protein